MHKCITVQLFRTDIGQSSQSLTLIRAPTSFLVHLLTFALENDELFFCSFLGIKFHSSEEIEFRVEFVSSKFVEAFVDPRMETKSVATLLLHELLFLHMGFMEVVELFKSGFKYFIL